MLVIFGFSKQQRDGPTDLLTGQPTDQPTDEPADQPISGFLALLFHSFPLLSFLVIFVVAGQRPR